MEFEPFLCLLDAIVMEFVIDLPHPQRGQQIGADLLRELARMNSDLDGSRHPPVVARARGQDKPCCSEGYLQLRLPAASRLP